MTKWLKPIASLRFTVVLLSLSMVLVLAGTLAQVNHGVWTVVDDYFRSPLVYIKFQLFFPSTIQKIPGGILFPGGLTLGLLLMINLLAAHLVRFRFTWKRAGSLITHFGVIVLIIGEFVTGVAAKEGKMAIFEGGSSNFTEDNRSVELAIIDPSPTDHDRVTVIPGSKLAGARGALTDPRLPFGIRVEQWMPNSQILGPMQATPDQLARATDGLGTQMAATPAPQATGVDNKNDLPAAYVTLLDDSGPVGTYLATVWFTQPQTVTVGGKQYYLQLRFTRSYKPYTIHLIDFKHDKFVGTEMARNYSSLVRLEDPSRNVDRQVLIYMNHPLRYAGETFYQASFMEGDTGTVLQVVRNPGWMLPYVSCTLVTVGMLMHFGLRLTTFVRRQNR